VIVNTGLVAAYDGQSAGRLLGVEGRRGGMTLPSRATCRATPSAVHHRAGIFETPCCGMPKTCRRARQAGVPPRLGKPSDYASCEAHRRERDLTRGDRLDGAIRCTEVARYPAAASSAREKSWTLHVALRDLTSLPSLRLQLAHDLPASRSPARRPNHLALGRAHPPDQLPRPRPLGENDSVDADQRPLADGAAVQIALWPTETFLPSVSGCRGRVKHGAVLDVSFLDGDHVVRARDDVEPQARGCGSPPSDHGRVCATNHSSPWKVTTLAE